MEKIPAGRHLRVYMGIPIGKITIETVATITQGFCFCDSHDRDEKNIPTAFRKKFIANGKLLRGLGLRM